MAVVEAPGVELLDGLREASSPVAAGMGIGWVKGVRRVKDEGVRESGGQMGQRGQEG